MPDPIKPAATLVLLRKAEGGSGVEVLLMRRHGQSAFMGGVHVFPGGKVDEHDFSGDYLEHLSPFDWEQEARRARQDAAAVRAHFVAVLRETFEEAGTLLASPRKSPTEVIRLDDPAVKKRFDSYRAALNDKENPESLLSIARKEDLLLRPDLLAYFDHWITPEIEKRRYDTRFFITAAPEGQEPEHDPRELTEWSWMTPEVALEKYTAGEIQLAPPTWVVIRRLRAFGTPAEAQAALARRRVATNLPRPRPKDGRLRIVLPGHPEYGEQLGEPVEPETDTPLGFSMTTAGKWEAIER